MARITWVDSQMSDEWDEVDTTSSLLCETTGYIMAVTDDRVVMAHTLNRAEDQPRVGGQIAIPRSAIKSYERLRVA